MSSKLGPIRSQTAGLASLGRLEKITSYERNVVSTLRPSILIGSSPFLQVATATIKAWMSLNFGQIPPPTAEIAALNRLEKKTK